MGNEIQRGTLVPRNSLSAGCGKAMMISWWRQTCCRNNTLGVSLGIQASLLSVDFEWCATAFHSGRSPAFSRWQISLEKVLPFVWSANIHFRGQRLFPLLMSGKKSRVEQSYSASIQAFREKKFSKDQPKAGKQEGGTTFASNSTEGILLLFVL